MRHFIAIIIVIILAVLLLVPLFWWIFYGFSFFQTYDVVTQNKTGTSTSENLHMIPRPNPVAPKR